MITLICILAVGFVSIAHFFLQDAYGGADRVYKESYKVYSFATNKFLRYDDVHVEVLHTPHYTYYHYPGNSTTTWEHYQAWPAEHGHFVDREILGKRYE